MWLCRFPKTTIIMYDQGNVLLSHKFENYLNKNEYGINEKFETTNNTQEN